MITVIRIAAQCIAAYITIRAGMNLADAYIFTDDEENE